MKLIKNKIILSLLIAVFVVPNIKANNGQDLFKQNCSACHKVDAKVIGPALKGVKAKWVDAGEEANLIKWVQNAPELFKSGESQLAKDIWDYSPSEMTAQPHLTAEQVNEIFDYVENYVPEEVVEVESENSSRKPGEALSDEIIYTAEEAAAINKKRNDFNRMVFFFLFFLAACLLGGIVSISKTIQTFLTLIIKKGETPKSDKPSGKGNAIASVILLLILSTPFSGFSMTIDTDISGWLIVSDIDIMVLFVGNLLLFWVLMDHKKTLKTIIAQYDESLLKKRSADGKEVKEETITQLLTGAVAIEDEASILMDHDFDGIRELDNNLPPWWVWGFVASIIFAVFYLTHYHVTKTGDLQIAEYDKTVAEAQIEVDEYMSAMAMNVDESNVTILTESADIDNGKALFTTNCVVCHKAKGEGLIGPNLTDKFWINGDGSISEVFKMIKYGNANGMPEHESKMNPVELQQVSSYVLQLEYTEGKAPEGEEVK